MSFSTVELLSDVIFKDLKIDIDHPMHISANMKDVYHIRWDEGSRMTIKLKKSFLEQLLIYQNFKPVISYFSYFDSGYNILDHSLNKIVFISRNNKIKLSIDEKSNATEYKVLMNLDGEGGVDSPYYITGEQNLNIDMLYKIYAHDSKKSDIIDDSDVTFHKFQLNSEKYQASVSGNLKRSDFTTNKLGQINVEINNFSYFTKVIDSLLYKNHADLLKNLFLNISENQYDPQVDKLSFSIVGTKNGIKYGNMDSQALFILFIQNQQQFRG